MPIKHDDSGVNAYTEEGSTRALTLGDLRRALELAKDWPDELEIDGDVDGRGDVPVKLVQIMFFRHPDNLATMPGLSDEVRALAGQPRVSISVYEEDTLEEEAAAEEEF